MEKGQELQDFLSLVSIEGFEERYSKDIFDSTYFGMPLAAIVDAEKRLRSSAQRNLSYFSMEYGLATSFYNPFVSTRPIDRSNSSPEHEICSNNMLADYFFTLDLKTIIDLPIYSGGLGVLAGDTVKTMADYTLPAACVGILWNTGYFRQRLWFKYGQLPEAIEWDRASYPGLVPLKNKIKIRLRSEDIWLRIWKYYVYSYDKRYAVPLILLDSNVEENSEKNRRLTDQLYRSDNSWIKIMQRVILGMGGVRALEELGYCIDIYHMNEGHAVFAYLEKARGIPILERKGLKDHFAYTCHTPVEAGHDRFSSYDLSAVLNKEDFELAEAEGKDKGGMINLTLLAMNVSGRINAVSKNHQAVMHLQFPSYKERIQYVTNGVHHHTWTSERFKKLWETYAKAIGPIPADPMSLAKVESLQTDQEFRARIWDAHQENKKEFCRLLSKWSLKEDVFTVCWARRIAAYKRPSLILQDIERLVSIARERGPLQIIFAGKAHPSDNLGFAYINQILEQVNSLTEKYDYLKVVLIENYDISLARKLVSSVDVWLNNPLPPFEASGTSGMKAILNAVVQMSTIDGWVVEAQDKAIGKFFGYQNGENELGHELNLRLKEDSENLYAALEELVTLYYQTTMQGKVDLSSAWLDMMVQALACSARFNTYRMLDEYKKNVWNLA